MDTSGYQSEILKIMFGISKNIHRMQSKSKLQPAQFHLLLSLSKYGEWIEYENETCKKQVLSHLVKDSKVSKAAVSRTIHECEQKGYISIIKLNEDKRKVTVILREKGMQELIDFKEKMDQYMTKIFEGMGEEDVKEMIRIMTKFNSILEMSTRKDDVNA